MLDPNTLAQRLGQLLRDARGDRIQDEVAFSAGISDSTLSNYERGEVIPSLPMLFTLFEILEINAEELLVLLHDDDDEPNGATKVAA